MQKKALFIPFLFVGFIAACSSATQTSSNESPANANSIPTQTSPIPPSSAITPCSARSPEAADKIVITAPCDGSRVAQRSFVWGTVSGSNAQVWVVIHPLETSDYWVQPSVTIRDGGKWKVLCYFGENGPQHSGKPYEVQAFMNPKEKLSEGQLLSTWPQTEAKSQPIEVVRE